MSKVETLLQPFRGYVELAMYFDAANELDSLPEEFKIHPTVLLARLDLLIEMEKWEDGALLGESLCTLFPKETQFWIKRAYCLHELNQTLDAKNTLLTGPPELKNQAVYYYNLACYESQLGNMASAKQFLGESFKRDKGLRQEALDDPDLQPVWNDL